MITATVDSRGLHQVGQVTFISSEATSNARVWVLG